jgi:hypothetical protein
VSRRRCRGRCVARALRTRRSRRSVSCGGPLRVVLRPLLGADPGLTRAMHVSCRLLWLLGPVLEVGMTSLPCLIPVRVAVGEPGGRAGSG